eukprot:jgi/Ulvmu1/6692/UM030_0023.1
MFHAHVSDLARWIINSLISIDSSDAAYRGYGSCYVHCCSAMTVDYHYRACGARMGLSNSSTPVSTQELPDQSPSDGSDDHFAPSKRLYLCVDGDMHNQAYMASPHDAVPIASSLTACLELFHDLTIWYCLPEDTVLQQTCTSAHWMRAILNCVRPLTCSFNHRGTFGHSWDALLGPWDSQP